MSNDEGSYAPKSPDLSSFLAATPPSHLPTSTYNNASTSFHPPGPGTGSPYANRQPQPRPTTYASEPYANYNAAPSSSPYSAHSPVTARPSQHQYLPPQHYGQIPPPNYAIPAPASAPTSGPQPYYSSSYTETQTTNPHYQLPPQAQQLQPPQIPPAAYNNQHPTAAGPSGEMPPRKAAVAQVAPEPEIMSSPVRTKFPTARIKRIMQADEEVGKVAQQTPIAVGKALELFMVQIVSKSADVAKDKNSKRISAQMLKQAVATNPQWDFLQDIVAKVSEKEESAKPSRAKQETDSDEDIEPEPKKKGRGGRKKKAAS